MKRGYVKATWEYQQNGETKRKSRIVGEVRLVDNVPNVIGFLDLNWLPGIQYTIFEVTPHDGRDDRSGGSW